MNLSLYCDGGSRGNPGPAAAGVVVATADGTPLVEAGYVLGRLTNNQAEYRGLLLGVQAAVRLGAKRLEIWADSELMVKQINGQYRVKSPNLKPEHAAVMAELSKIESWSAQHVRREGNQRADELVNLALDCGEDVIEIDQARKPDGGRPQSHGPGCAQQPQVNGSPGVVEVLVTRAAGSVCPAPCAPGDLMTISGTLPSGMCVDAAGAILPAVRACRDAQLNPGAIPRSPGIVETACPRSDCGATFEVRPS